MARLQHSMFGQAPIDLTKLTESTEAFFGVNFSTTGNLKVDGGGLNNTVVMASNNYNSVEKAGAVMHGRHGWAGESNEYIYLEVVKKVEGATKVTVTLYTKKEGEDGSSADHYVKYGIFELPVDVLNKTNGPYGLGLVPPTLIGDGLVLGLTVDATATAGVVICGLEPLRFNR